MPEMLEIGKKIIVLLFLFWFALRDYKTKLLGTGSLLCFVGTGVGLHFLLGGDFLGQMFYGSLVGLGCLLISMLTRESMGIGDGLLFVGLGMFFSLEETFLMFFWSLFLVGGYAGICLIIKKRTKKERIPMVPFVLLSYVLWLV